MSTIDEKVGAASAAGVASKDAEAEAKDAGATTTAEAVAPSPEEVSQATEAAPAPADEIVDGEFEMLDAGATQEAAATAPPEDVPDAVFETLETGADSTAVDLTDANTFAPVEGDPEYVNVVHNVCHTYSNAEKQFLDLYKDLGRFIQSYIDAKEVKKVSDALKMIVKDVSTASRGRLSHLKEDSLRKALKLNNALTQEQFELAKSLGISLRNILPLCGNNVEPDERDEILQKVYEGKLKQTEISGEVKALKPPTEKGCFAFTVIADRLSMVYSF